MKKIIISLGLCIVLLLNLVACSSGISIATGGTSGTYYAFSGVVAQYLNENYKDMFNLKVVSTGASKANIQLVDSGDAKIAIVQNDVMTYAYNAQDMFEGEKPIQSFSAIASCYPEAVQIVANKNINSIQELKGKKVSVGDAGSGTEFNAKQILDAYGIDIEKDIEKNNQSFADSCDSLKNGTLDAAFVVAGAPTTAITELATTYEFNLLSIDPSHVQALKNSYGYYTEVQIPAGTYEGVNNNIRTVAVMATFIARNDLDEDLVYNFTKKLFEDKDNFSHQKAELLNPQTGHSGISIPFHKGAERYYQEIGIN